MALVLAVAVVVATAAPSYISALTAPGTDSFGARSAEWARTHGLSSEVDFAERISYDLHPPKKGGTPAGGLPRVGAHPALVGSPPATARVSSGLPAPASIAPVAEPALAGEGVWSTEALVSGRPALRVTYLRPDTVHTSYVAGVVWMDPQLLRFALHPGYLDPGSGSWGEPATIPLADRSGLLAAFNSGFRLYASRGGFYDGGHTARALVAGAASMVIYRDGSATVGVWDSTVRMTSQVVAVRQNLAPIVLGGKPVAGLASNSEQQWGATLGNAYYVWRSGLGVTADGALVYVAGPSLSATTLASLLARAGAVTAMELDINPEWTQLVLYRPVAAGATPAARDLLPSMQQPASRYFGSVSRDFFTVHGR